MSIADYLDDGADYVEDDPKQCGNYGCRDNEDGYCLRFEWYEHCNNEK